MNDDERPGIPHNMIAHVLICLPVVHRLGDWLHEHTEPIVPTWRARWSRLRAREAYGRLL